MKQFAQSQLSSAALQSQEKKMVECHQGVVMGYVMRWGNLRPHRDPARLPPSRSDIRPAQPHLGGTDAARLVLSDCPFSLDDLLAADFELDECMARIALAQSGPPRGKDAGWRP